MDWDIIITAIIISWPISLVWFAIRYFLKRKEEKGETLSKNAKGWLEISIFAGILFIILPFIIVPLTWVGDYLLGIILLIPATMAAFSIATKKK